jgi:hypothetical protein
VKPALARFGLPALVVGLALAVNLTKAVHIDDAAHFAIARWIREHPSHPMSGVVHWGEHPAPIHAMNQPPGLFFLIAGVMALFGGDAVWAQHLMIGAFVAISVVAYLDLARRALSPPWATLTAVALFLGPAFLPSQNVMTDVPLLALWLVFFALLDRAGDAVSMEASPPKAGAAGAYLLAAATVAAAACFVKYTSLVLLAVLALDLALYHRRRLAVLLVPLGALAAWSAWNVADYGGVHLAGRSVEVGHSPSLGAVIGIVLGRAGLWVITLGAIAPFALAFAPRGETLRKPRAWVVAVVLLGVGTAIGQVLAAAVPEHLGGESVLHSFLRSAFLGIGGAACAGALRAARSSRHEHRTRLLVAWFAITGVFIVVLSPFVAVRHVLLSLPPLFLLLARGASAAEPPLRAKVVVWGTVPLALAVAFADARYAAVYRDFAAEIAAAPAPAGATTWTVGHWGWQYYAERAGLREYDPGASVLRPGDRLIRPRIVDQQPILPADRARLALVGERVVRDAGPLAALRTVTNRQGFYAVWGGLPWTFTLAPLEVFEIWTVTDAPVHDGGDPQGPATGVPGPTPGGLR